MHDDVAPEVIGFMCDVELVIALTTAEVSVLEFLGGGGLVPSEPYENPV